MINMAWPRTPDVPWYDNYIVALSAVIVIGIGLAYMLVAAVATAVTLPTETPSRCTQSSTTAWCTPSKTVELGIL